MVARSASFLARPHCCDNISHSGFGRSCWLLVGHDHNHEQESEREAEKHAVREQQANEGRNVALFFDINLSLDLLDRQPIGLKINDWVIHMMEYRLIILDDGDGSHLVLPWVWLIGGVDIIHDTEDNEEEDRGR